MMEGLCRPTTIFFDFGGVLAEEGFRAALLAIARETGRDPAVLEPLAYEMAWSTGFVVGGCDEAGFWRAFREATGITADDVWLTDMVLSRFTLRPRMFALADAARAAGIRTAILSDQTEWLGRLDARHDIFSHFDAVFNSYHHGVSKRDAAFFALALSAMGAKAEASLFIDDAPRNVELAASLGFHTILYRDEAGFFRDFADVCPTLGAPRV
ncbi:MAG TPA: HAD family phosphatase [Solidesulfovibrio sp.]|nr:HAD family phosphatase [Solidesulfovibrio sp.]